jgi:acetyltransferase-like isoleucine patch superfamily enzyme
MRETVKTLFRAAALLAVLPRIVALRIASAFIGGDRALESSSQSVARVPGIRGQYMRRAFLSSAGVTCHASATVCFGTLFSKRGAVLDENVYVGPYCHLGLVHLERDVLLAAGVHIPSGARIHGTGDPDRPIREQGGVVTRVRIGRGSWIGSGSVILADVGCNCVVGAGAVVTSPIPDDSVAAGVPARVLRSRRLQ